MSGGPGVDPRAVRPLTRTEEVAAATIELLRAAFANDDWEVLSTTGPDVGFDLLVRRGGLLYAVELKAVADARKQELQAYLADATVRARVFASKAAASQLAVVAAPVLTDRQWDALRDFAGKYLGRTAYGCVDQAGRLELVGRGLEGVGYPEVGGARAPRPVSPPPSSNPFTDLNQWLLKVLLAPRLPDNLLRAPRAVARNPHRLAGLAGVSPPSAHRFVRLFATLGFVHAGRDGLRVTDETRLLADWRAAASPPPAERRLQWLLPRSDKDRQLREALGRSRESTFRAGEACVALYAAADLLGFRRVHGVSPHVYYRRASSLLPESIGAAEVGPNEPADLHVRATAFPESVFRGAVTMDGVTCTDVIQTWIDTSRHPVRGEEQADLIWRRALAPMIERASGR